MLSSFGLSFLYTPTSSLGSCHGSGTFLSIPHRNRPNVIRLEILCPPRTQQSAESCRQAVRRFHEYVKRVLAPASGSPITAACSSPHASTSRAFRHDTESFARLIGIASISTPLMGQAVYICSATAANNSHKVPFVTQSGPAPRSGIVADQADVLKSRAWPIPPLPGVIRWYGSVMSPTQGSQPFNKCLPGACECILSFPLTFVSLWEALCLGTLAPTFGRFPVSGRGPLVRQPRYTLCPTVLSREQTIRPQTWRPTSLALPLKRATSFNLGSNIIASSKVP
ncbi:hypothetical protein B0T21DRAFT_345961 [Apiosordaria backusii]|uniref:Uncharacterized protein n=1 Tax=Apiosordaria backusii TaxID=314023 RepID=A0AA40EMP8_9PEZI|nr:hypothetical protein B0T21DRAFT_345961 [Apiosordaria backusii]